MPVTLAQLLEDRSPPVTARADEPLKQVLERMLEHDFSQLPVLDDGEVAEARVIGMVSTTSIARAGLHLDEAPGALRVYHALERGVSKEPQSADLWVVLKKVGQSAALLVLDEDNRLKGILTDYDFAEFLRQSSQDLLLVANVEAAVKELIQKTYAPRPESELAARVREQELGQQRSLMGNVRKVVADCLVSHSQNPQRLSAPLFNESFEKHVLRPASGEFDRLTFAQYNAILLNKECWATYEDRLGLPLKTFRRLLDKARNLRNRLAHNRGALSTTERDQLNYLRGLLDRILDSASGEVEIESDVDEEVMETVQAETRESAEERGFEALSNYLGRVGEEQERLRYSFEQIEKILGHTLSPAARENRSWWSNDGESEQALAWMEAGWRVVSVNLTNHHVNLARNTELQEAYLSAFGVLFRALNSSLEWPRITPSPAGRSWQDIAYLPEDSATTARLMLGFASGQRFRIELVIDSRDKARNKCLFDHLWQRREVVEKILDTDESPNWNRLDGRQSSQVALFYPNAVHAYSDPDDLEQLAEWVVRMAPRFYKALLEHYGPEASSAEQAAPREE